jgi:hypothetical protein
MSVMKLLRYQRDQIDNSEARELRQAEIRWGLLPCMEIKKDSQPTRGSESFEGADSRPCENGDSTGSDSGVNIA